MFSLMAVTIVIIYLNIIWVKCDNHNTDNEEHNKDWSGFSVPIHINALPRLSVLLLLKLYCQLLSKVEQPLFYL
jgi:hypothetical protein